ncbi:NAD-dependent epimerase/dehydratase family protein [Candidatus Pelagibacter sp.]|nr:NAD-dependent epimerase/dehydratase family protein [Candidatus Pelagibacter sp.]
MRDEVFVTGGCGYVGSLLVKKLIKNYAVTVLDTHWFGNYLQNNQNLKIIKGDIRYDLENIDFSKFKYVIHLANIANDPSVELDQVLSWEVNVLAYNF